MTVTYSLRYSINGSGRTAKTCMHVVRDDTQRTMCSRDGSNYTKTSDLSGPESIECERCRKVWNTLQFARTHPLGKL